MERKTHRSNVRIILVTLTFLWGVGPSSVLDIYRQYGKNPYLFLQVVKKAGDKLNRLQYDNNVGYLKKLLGKTDFLIS